MTDCPHDIVNRMRYHKRGGERGDYWACNECGHVFTPRNDSRERALAEFVAAFDAWINARAGELATGRGHTWKDMIEARAALDATEEADG